MKDHRQWKALAITVLTLWSVGCHPRELPGFREIAKREEERITRETEEAIKNSPAFQELDRLCTQEIPRPAGFVPINKYKDLHGERFLGYGYHSKADYQSVQNFYIKHFSEHGWQLTRQKDSGWGQQQIEFRHGQYLARIYNLEQADGANYSLHCEKVAEVKGTP